MKVFDKTSAGNVTGAIAMTVAMALFSVEDALLKQAAQNLPIAQVLFLFGLFGFLCFAGHAAATGHWPKTRDVTSPIMLTRMGFEITGRLFFTLAFVFTPLSSTTVILQATPLVVVAAAAIFFGETVGWRRWSAIILGLIGVLIIIGPSSSDFTPASWLAVIGLLGFAGRDLTSRAAPSDLPLSTLGIMGFAALMIAGAGFGFWEGRAPIIPDSTTALIMIAAGLIGVIAYCALMIAMRTGEVGAVTPFRYTRLPFGVLIGVIIFAEALTTRIWIGSALILVASAIILLRGRTRH